MLRTSFVFAALALTVLSIACGDDASPSGALLDGGAPPPTPTGSTPTPPVTPPPPAPPAAPACFDGSGCAAGAYCLVVGANPEGSCQPIPASCTGDGGAPTCGCIQPAAPCPQGGTKTCSGFNGSWSVGCGQDLTTQSKKLNEPCSQFVYCADGLYCSQPDVNQLGSCKQAPAACKPDDEKTCLETELAADCPSGKAPNAVVLVAVGHFISLTCR